MPLLSTSPDAGHDKINLKLDVNGRVRFRHLRAGPVAGAVASLHPWAGDGAKSAIFAHSVNST